jgi:tetratricopeptide (TPR) repeat protein
MPFSPITFTKSVDAEPAREGHTAFVRLAPTSTTEVAMIFTIRRWSLGTRAILIAAAAGAVIGSNAAAQAAQQADSEPAILQLTSSSEAAKARFRKTLFEIENYGGNARIRQTIDSTLALDPGFALARAYQAYYAPGTAQARVQAISAVMGDMGAVSAPELLLALRLREVAAGRGVASRPLVQSASAMVPGDADVAFLSLLTQTAGKPAAEQVELYRGFIRRFPQITGAHNLLAYQLIAVGDSDGALREVEEYVRLAPDYFNSHDSFADVLLVLGRPHEALPHVQRTLELTPSVSATASAVAKRGVIALMTGDTEAARAEFADAVERFENPAIKLGFRYWLVGTEAYVGDRERALDAVNGILALPALTPGQTAGAHITAAMIEANLGDPDAAVPHLSAAAAAQQPASATYYGARAIAMARAGDLEEARAAAAQYQSMVSSVNTTHYTINALVALAGQDLATARRELDRATPTALLTRAARADLLMQEGQRSQADRLLQEIATSSIKTSDIYTMAFWRFVAKMHAARLARAS